MHDRTLVCLRALRVFFLPLLLSACQVQQTAQPLAVDRGLPAPASVALDAPIPRLSPAQPPTPAPSSADLINDPQRFKGMSMDAVIALLGRPSFQRHDADAEIWQYYGPASACVLDLFVYPAPEGGILQVAYAELRSRGTASAAAMACMAQIMDGQRG